jgi:hypothetical protein
MKPEEKVNLAINMIDVCVCICADSIKDRDKSITEEELLERVRARIMHGKRRHSA